jgi:dTDP-4-dehydrorhamnose reductase
MTIAITGAAGQLGQALVQRLRAGYDVAALTRGDLDLTRHADVMQTVARLRPTVIINCAGYNAVDRAEDDAQTALASNALAVRSLARAAREHDATLIHYSSDFVFDGETDRPYVEQDDPAPRSIYAQSKLLGEWFAADAPRHYVLRVESLFGGPNPHSSVDHVVTTLIHGTEARVFTDRVVSPAYVEDVAAATEALLTRDAEPGLYHCVNGGHATFYDLALEAARLLGRPARLVPIAMADVTLRAPRPRFCALSNDKLSRAVFTMPTWQDALGRYLAGRASQLTNGE